MRGCVQVVWRDPGIGIEAPVHQVAHIGPPVDGVDGDADEMMVIAHTGDDLYKIGGGIIARFARVNAWIPPYKLIAVEEVMCGMLAGLIDMIVEGPTDLINPGDTQTVQAKDRQIMSTAIMSRLLQPVGISSVYHTSRFVAFWFIIAIK